MSALPETYLRLQIERCTCGAEDPALIVAVDHQSLQCGECLGRVHFATVVRSPFPPAQVVKAGARRGIFWKDYAQQIGASQALAIADEAGEGELVGFSEGRVTYGGRGRERPERLSRG